MTDVTVRKEMPEVALTEAEFKQRYRQHFFDPAFEAARSEIDRIAEIAWQAYADSRKAPRTRAAGPGFAEPDYQLSVEWIAASEAIKAAERRQKDPAAPSRMLLINGASRSEHTCPGESSKSWRLAMLAHDVFAQEPHWETEILDLSRLTSEYGRVIYPCKTCVSTAMPPVTGPAPAIPITRRRRCRLDERHLRHVGGGARRDDHLPGELVRRAVRAEADDRSPRLRRRRQSRPDIDARQERRTRQGA